MLLFSHIGLEMCFGFKDISTRAHCQVLMELFKSKKKGERESVMLFLQLQSQIGVLSVSKLEDNFQIDNTV